MTYTSADAKPLLASEEYELFRTSFEPAIDELNATELKLATRRCRAARDKFRDLHERQERAPREALEARGEQLDVSQRMADQATILTEALDRYEARLAALRR